jgi:hypothetical protein
MMNFSGTVLQLIPCSQNIVTTRAYGPAPNVVSQRTLSARNDAEIEHCNPMYMLLDWCFHAHRITAPS